MPSFDFRKLLFLEVAVFLQSASSCLFTHKIVAVVKPTLQTASDRSHFAVGVFSACRFSNVEDILPIEENLQHIGLKGVTGT